MENQFLDNLEHVDLFGRGYDAFGQNSAIFFGSEVNKQKQTLIEAEVPVKHLTDGESQAKITMVDGYHKSKDFVSGVSGWILNSDGTYEFN